MFDEDTELVVLYDNIFNSHSFVSNSWTYSKHNSFDLHHHHQQNVQAKGIPEGKLRVKASSIDTACNAAVVLVSGGTAGAVSRTATAPMDRLKVLLQAGNAWKGQKVGVVQGLKSIYKEGGWTAFFRGNGVNVIKIVPEMGIKFAANDMFRQSICKDPARPSIPERFASGALAGVLAQCVIYPLEIAKTRLAVSPSGQFTGLFDCLNKSVTYYGVKSLYRGLLASVIGVVPYAGTDLAVYTFLRDTYLQRNPDKELGALTVLACAAVSCTCGSLVAYPLQLVRTKLQAQDIPGMPKYNGIVHCFRTTVDSEGFKGLYRGLLPNFLKALPAITISYVVFEKSKKFWEDQFREVLKPTKAHLIA